MQYFLESKGQEKAKESVCSKCGEIFLSNHEGLCSCKVPKAEVTASPDKWEEVTDKIQKDLLHWIQESGS